MAHGLPSGGTKVGRMDDQRFHSHRFSNYTAWLDRQAWGKKDKGPEHKGPEGGPHGFAARRPPAPPKVGDPIEVHERAFASGLPVKRMYDRSVTTTATTGTYIGKTEEKMSGTRTCPLHYPNVLAVQARDYYTDHQRRSCNTDMRVAKPQPGDAELRRAVPDDMVKKWVDGEAGIKVNPGVRELSGILFERNERCRPEAERLATERLAASAVPQAGSPRSWNWCMGGRKNPLLAARMSASASSPALRDLGSYSATSPQRPGTPTMSATQVLSKFASLGYAGTAFEP